MAHRRRNSFLGLDSDRTLNIPVLGQPDHDAYRSFCEWQVLQLFVTLNLLTELWTEHGQIRSAYQDVIQLEEGARDDAAATDLLLNERHRQRSASPPALPADTNLARNVKSLRVALGLSGLEAQLLHWRCLLELHPAMQELERCLGDLSTLQSLHILSVALGRPLADVQACLAPQGKLTRTGLLELQSERTTSLLSKLEIKPGLAEQLVLPAGDPQSANVLSLFRHQFSRSRPPMLGLQHYAHLSPQVDLLQAMLQVALVERRSGVNILIHGEPGTGKTQLAAVLAEKLGARLHELALTCPRGRPIRGQDRLSSYRLAQGLLEGAPGALLVFDEVEDVLRPQQESDKSDLGIKAWMNQCLESNPVPAFWITNRVHGLDPAYLRRFDMVLEVERPPLHVRRALLREQTAELDLPEVWLEQVAHAPGWSPALLTRAVNVVHSLQGHMLGKASPAQPMLAHLLNGSLRAMGEAPLPEPAPVEKSDAYLINYANTDVPLADLLQGLRARSRARLLLHGLPGTGKSHFAQHVGHALERPVQMERGSTLLGSFVGETERNLARAFARAAQEQSVLVIDEIDGLLHPRNHAVRSWEVSQVNEFLLQLEKFEGMFIGTTNRLDQLDAAAMRRFDLKIAFATLQLSQLMELLRALAEVAGLCPDQVEHQARRRQTELVGMTMGDVQAFSNQCELLRPATPEALIDGLIRAAPHREGAEFPWDSPHEPIHDQRQRPSCGGVPSQATTKYPR